ncbi:hypothetical protein Leryth_025218 [Lithospermum erythrorhizon]|nr:hypothetical protein Leryth_025218 [Lithospermum erythrorhizon]
MSEQAYTVASDSEATGEEKSSADFPEIAIGIDIGTSHCSVAVWNGSQVEVLRNTRNQKLMRSYVTFKDEVPSGGVTNQLSNDYEMLSGAAIFNILRLIGRVDTDPVVHASKGLPFLVQTLDIGVRPFIAALVNNMWRSTTPEEVLAIFLVEVRAMAELHLKRPVRNAVLTIPVSFNRFQLTRVERACAMAGLHVLRLMPEPTAVSLLYAQQQQQQAIQENMGSGTEKIALIFNMGAGYCDVALSATAGGVSQIKALVGTVIGGEDLLQNTMHHILPDMDTLFCSHGFDEIRKMGLLRVTTQDAIHKLTIQPDVQIDIDLGSGIKINKVLDRKEFEEINQNLFGKCRSLIKRCLDEAKVEAKDVNDVILVGGCSKVPKIQSIIKEIFNREELYSGMDAMEAAVCGAALEGAVTSGVSDPFGILDLLTIQVTPMSIGIQADGSDFVPIIHKNTTMPWKRIIKLTGIPQASKGVPEINVCVDIDSSNVMRIFAGAVIPGANHPATPAIEVRMPTIDDGHGWCAEALKRVHGSKLELATLQKKAQQ